MINMPAASHRTFDKLMAYVVFIYNKTGSDIYGEPKYVSIPRGPYRAAIVERQSTNRGSDGLEIQTTTTAYINTDGTRIESDDKIVLPVQFGGDKRKIGEVINWPDPQDGVIYGVEVNFL
jgi:hypothetical protein